jgi:hypothetical protein
MIRITKIIVACCLLMVATPLMVEAQNRGYKNSNRYGNAAESKIKAGIETEIFLLQAFGEYKVDEKLGVRVAVAYDFLHFYSLEKLMVPICRGEDALLLLKSINLPITLRLYPGEDRQACFLGGVHLGYVTKTEVLITRDASKLDIVEARKNNRHVDIDKIPDHITKLRFGMILGFDYEASFGLTFGICFKKDFVTMMEANDTFANWNLRPTLGYNFAKLFE